jgi:putative flippase GtrA
LKHGDTETLKIYKSLCLSVSVVKDEFMATITTPFHKKELTRFSRFLTVGAIGTALDFTVLTLLKLAGWPTLIANSFSFTTGLVNNFTLNRLWTFGDVQSDWRKQLVQYTLISLVGLALNDLIVLSLEHVLGLMLRQPEFGYLPAKVIATGVVVFWNYFANRTWTFKTINREVR